MFPFCGIYDILKLDPEWLKFDDKIPKYQVWFLEDL